MFLPQRRGEGVSVVKNVSLRAEEVTNGRGGGKLEGKWFRGIVYR